MLTRQKFDLFFFIGSTHVGRQIAIEAAKNLVPCILELGGKCPVIVDRDCHIETAVRKTLAAKVVERGQVCVCGDYVLVDESILNQFITVLLANIKASYGNSSKGDTFAGNIVNSQHCDRLARLISTSGGEIMYGGQVDRDARFVETTVILNPSLDSPVMNEEIFGPVIPIVSYKTIHDVIDIINKRGKPLVVYYFGKE